MISVQRVFPLSEFVRKTKSFTEDLEVTKEPIALTVNGKVKMVVVDPESYDAYMRIIRNQDFIEAVLEGLRDLREGRHEPGEAVIAELKSKYDL